MNHTSKPITRFFLTLALLFAAGCSAAPLPAPTATLAPTDTPVPPTATPLPPTAMATLEPTATTQPSPTVVPTEANVVLVGQLAPYKLRYDPATWEPEKGYSEGLFRLKHRTASCTVDGEAFPPDGVRVPIIKGEKSLGGNRYNTKIINAADSASFRVVYDFMPEGMKYSPYFIYMYGNGDQQTCLRDFDKLVEDSADLIREANIY